MKKTLKLLSYTLFIVFIFLIGNALFLFLFGTVPMILGYSPSPFYLLILDGLSFIALMPIVFFFKKRHNISFEFRFSFKQIIIMFILGSLLFVVVNPFLKPIDFINSLTDELIRIETPLSKSVGLISLLSGINMIIIAPIIEELVYRGIIFNYCRKKTSLLWAVLISASLFSIVHFNPEGIIFHLIYGVMFAIVYYKTNNLLIPILLHSSINAIAFFSEPSTIGLSTESLLIYLAIYLGALAGAIVITVKLKIPKTTSIN